MTESHVLRPPDVPVAIYMALFANKSFSDVAHYLDISPSSAFRGANRLIYSGLAREVEGERRINVEALLEFLLHGVRYAFPARKGMPKRGIATAHAAPMLRHDLDTGTDPVVWPYARGNVVGAALQPLIPSAPELPVRCPPVYDLLTLIDALRIGNARDREVASQLLRDRLERTVVEPPISWSPSSRAV